MSISKLAMIQADPQFRKDCEQAEAKARRALERARDRIDRAEEAELERHRRKMSELSQRQRAVFEEIEAKFYDPLEEAGFARAEQRLAERIAKEELPDL